jgi:hypothetical protein
MDTSTANVEVQEIKMAKEGDSAAVPYVQSYHVIRTLVGVLGIALPFILIIGWRLLYGEWNLQGSLSAYYHTGVRDAFVSVLVVVGILLVTYKLANTAADNRLGTVAGLAAIGVAFIPTTIHSKKQTYAENTAVQEWLTPIFAKWVHFFCAGTFIILLGFICLFFAKVELEKKQEGLSDQDHWKSFETWCNFHKWMAYIIFGAVAFIAVTQLLKVGEEYSLLIGESLATFAFAASWLVKGWNPRLLRAVTTTPGAMEARSR